MPLSSVYKGRQAYCSRSMRLFVCWVRSLVCPVFFIEQTTFNTDCRLRISTCQTTQTLPPKASVAVLITDFVLIECTAKTLTLGRKKKKKEKKTYTYFRVMSDHLLAEWHVSGFNRCHENSRSGSSLADVNSMKSRQVVARLRVFFFNYKY